MGLGTTEKIAIGEALASALSTAFSRIRSAGTSECAIVFDPQWRPTMDIVELVAAELNDCADVQSLTLVHPSSAMTFIASAIGLRAAAVQVATKRSVYDEVEDENVDATASKTMFVMAPGERVEHFVRRSVREAHSRAVRRFALLFDASCTPSIEIADLLAVELMQSGGVREIGLIHPRSSLDTLVATLRLRVPTVRVAYASATAPPR